MENKYYTQFKITLYVEDTFQYEKAKHSSNLNNAYVVWHNQHLTNAMNIIR